MDPMELGPTKFGIDFLARIVSDPLDKYIVIVPSGDRTFDFDVDPAIAYSAIDVGAVHPHPDVVTHRPQFDQLEDHLGVRPKVEFDLVSNGHVLDLLGGQKTQAREKADLPYEIVLHQGRNKKQENVTIEEARIEN